MRHPTLGAPDFPVPGRRKPRLNDQRRYHASTRNRCSPRPSALGAAAVAWLPRTPSHRRNQGDWRAPTAEEPRGELARQRFDGRLVLPLIGRGMAELGVVVPFLDVQKQKKTTATRGASCEAATSRPAPGRPAADRPAQRRARGRTLVACRPLGICRRQSALGISPGHTSARAARVPHQRSRLREIVSPGATMPALALLQRGDVVTGLHRATIWRTKMKLRRILHRE